MKLTAKPKYEWNISLSQDEIDCLQEMASFLVGKGNFQPCLGTIEFAKNILGYIRATPQETVTHP